MATSLYRVRTGSTATTSGRELLDTLETIGDSFARLQRIFDAMTAQKDGAAANATDYVTPAAVFGFVDSSDVLDSTTAMNAYAEINSFVGNAAAALEQCCSRFKQ